MEENKIVRKRKHAGGRHRTGYDLPKTVNYKPFEFEHLAKWGQLQSPEQNFSDVVHLMTADFIKTHPLPLPLPVDPA